MFSIAKYRKKKKSFSNQKQRNEILSNTLLYPSTLHLLMQNINNLIQNNMINAKSWNKIQNFVTSMPYIDEQLEYPDAMNGMFDVIKKGYPAFQYYTVFGSKGVFLYPNLDLKKHLHTHYDPAYTLPEKFFSRYCVIHCVYEVSVPYISQWVHHFDVEVCAPAIIEKQDSLCCLCCLICDNKVVAKSHLDEKISCNEFVTFTKQIPWLVPFGENNLHQYYIHIILYSNQTENEDAVNSEKGDIKTNLDLNYQQMACKIKAICTHYVIELNTFMYGVPVEFEFYDEDNKDNRFIIYPGCLREIRFDKSKEPRKIKAFIKLLSRVNEEEKIEEINETKIILSNEVKIEFLEENLKFDEQGCPILNTIESAIAEANPEELDQTINNIKQIVKETM